VSRGFIGVTLTDVTPGLQRALGLSVSHGAVVQDVTPRSPAERAGLKAYDVILEVEGQAVMTNQELIRDISGRKPGSIARLEVLREGRRQSLPIKLAERPARGDEFDDPQDRLNAPASPRPPLPDEDVPLGVWVREMDRIFTTKYDIPGSLHGVVVHRVDPAGPATQALRRNLVILEINRKATRSLAEYQQVVNALRAT
jgi:serine protease Do